jgi:hypothetical protein
MIFIDAAFVGLWAYFVQRDARRFVNYSKLSLPHGRRYYGIWAVVGIVLIAWTLSGIFGGWLI